MSQRFYTPAVSAYRSLRTILLGKISGLLGQGRVARTCQIPDIKAKYAALGLPRKDGVFVEVGGFDGEEFSNTSFLADLGWRGLYVEPVPAYCKKIRSRHRLNRVAVEQSAVAAEPGTLRLNLMGALSTLDAAAVESLKEISWSKFAADNAQALDVRADTLASILPKYDIPLAFDLMVIDVEGAEEAVVTALLANQWRPKVLIIELCDIHPDFTTMPDTQKAHARCRQALINDGYAEFYKDEINTVFQRSRPE